MFAQCAFNRNNNIQCEFNYAEWPNSTNDILIRFEIFQVCNTAFAGIIRPRFRIFITVKTFHIYLYL